MSTITRERVANLLQFNSEGSDCQSNAEQWEVHELARIALASLEAEAVCVIDQSNLDYLKSGSDADVWPASRAEMGDVLLYRSATPAPVSVPAAMEMDDDFDSAFEHGKAVGWNACRAAMLQGAGPVTIKANGGGSEKDEPPKRGWVVTHSGKDYFYREQGDAATHMNAAVESGIGVSLRSFIPEPVTTAYKLPGDFESFISWLTSGDGIPDWLINGDKLDDEKVSFLLKVYRAGSRDANGKKGEGIFVSKSSEMSVSGITIGESQCRNSPVIPDCSCRTCRPVTFSDSRFVVCHECGNKRCPHANDHRNACTGSNEPGQEGSAYPAAPQQEVNNDQ